MIDIHQAREEWGEAPFPMVPGHEITGVVRGVGTETTKYAVGDRSASATALDRGRRELRARHPRGRRPRRRGPAAVRGHHALLPAQPLGRRPRQAGRDRRFDLVVKTVSANIDVDAAYDRVVDSDVRYRFVIDIDTFGDACAA